MRPSIDEYFLSIAYVVASRATCPRASVGAVLYRDGYQLACGYNGACHGLPHCLDIGCLLVNDHCERAVHSEANAIIHAARIGVSTAGAVLAVTHFPCLSCVRLLINAGIVRVCYHEAYRMSGDAVLMLKQAKIEYVRI